MDFGVSKAVKKEEARGKHISPFTWVDKRKEGVVVSRFTDADVKGKNPFLEQQEASPTPTTSVGDLRGVDLGGRGAMDVVSAYLHTKEKEDVYVRIPNEIWEAVMGLREGHAWVLGAGLGGGAFVVEVGRERIGTGELARRNREELDSLA